MSESSAVQTIANRYRVLGQLGQGGMGAVYRVLDRLYGNVVALKQVHVPAANLEFASRALTASSSTDGALLALALEFRTLATLHHPHVVTVLSYGFDAGRRPYFTMHLVDQARTITEYGSELTLAEKIRLLTQTLQALAYLHRRGIVHRDLKPANVLVNGEGQVKVMDFGLAFHRQQTASESGLMTGTLAYMAPELLGGQPPSLASDFYALGVIAFELLVGYHPFIGQTAHQIIQKIMTEIPDTSMLDFDLAIVLDRLLAKEPSERFADAEGVIRALCQATEQPLPEESTVLRESFLKAAEFVGREAEFESLRSALDEAVAGKGSAWLVGGESGVGKSRLMDELRTRSAVEGALVLRGQGVDGGGLPYQLWREPLRRLAISSPLSDFEAGVLRDLVPDIDDLLERTISPLPTADGAVEHQRLMATIVEVFKRQSQPILLIMEDLQWARESLEPLMALNRLVEKLPLLIVGNYRDDEAPDLPRELPNMITLKLHRLNETAIADLSAAMLGEAGRQPEVIELLKRETEGNVFFLVEVVRALAEEAGRLSEVGKHKLPAHVFAEGVQSIVRRRIKRLPVDDQPLLRFAAVVGRRIDLNVMRQVDDETDYESWLIRCVNAAILDTPGSHEWQFAHDKLREGILKDLAENEYRRLNHLAAEAIEAAYPNDLSYAAVLADHWSAAGNHEKELNYLLLVIEQIIEDRADYPRIRDLTERALVLSEALPNMDYQRMVLWEWAGDAYRKLNHYDKALAAYEHSLRLAKHLGDTNKRAGLMVGLGWIAFPQGDYEAAAEWFRQSLALFRQLGSKRGIASSLTSLGSSVHNLGDYTAAKTHFAESIVLNREIQHRWGAATALANMVSTMIAEGDYEGAQPHNEQSLTIFRNLNHAWGIAFALGNAGIIAQRQGDYVQAETYFSQALKITQEIDDQQGIAYGLKNLGTAMLSRGDARASSLYFQQSLMITQAIHDPWGSASNLHHLGEAYYHQGDFEAARDALDQSLTIFREIHNQEGIANILASRAFLSVELQQFQASKDDVSESLKNAFAIKAMPIMLKGLVASAYLACGQGDTQRSAELVGLVSGHPRLMADVRGLWIERLLTRLAALLSPEALAAALEKGKALDLETTIKAHLPLSGV